MNIQHLKIFYPLRMIQVFPIRPKLPFAGKVIRECISYLQLCRTDSCTAQLTMPSGPFVYTPPEFTANVLSTPQKGGKLKTLRKLARGL